MIIVMLMMSAAMITIPTKWGCWHRNWGPHLIDIWSKLNPPSLMLVLSFAQVEIGFEVLFPFTHFSQTEDTFFQRPKCGPKFLIYQFARRTVERICICCSRRKSSANPSSRRIQIYSALVLLPLRFVFISVHVLVLALYWYLFLCILIHVL